MYCGTATFWVNYFSEPLLLNGPYLSKAAILFRKSHYCKIILTISVNFQQVTSSSFKTLKYPRVHRVVYYSENLSIKYHDQNYCIKIAFSRQHSREQSIKEYEKLCLVKGNKFKAAIFWSKVLFSSLYPFPVRFWKTFWTGLVCLFYKLLLPFLTFMNCEGPYLAEGFLHNLSSYFGIVFAQLGVITRTRNKIVKISECYFTINPFQK